MYWFMGRRSALTTHKKLVLYKQILKPVWTCGIQLWGCTKPNNIVIIQRFQNKVLRAIVNAPWYVRNADHHRNLKMEMVTAQIKRCDRKHEERFHHHDNAEAIHLLDNTELLGRLKRTKPFELANQHIQMSIRTVKHNLIFILLTCILYKLQGVFKTTCFGQTSDHLQVYKSLIYTYTLCIDIS